MRYLIALCAWGLVVTVAGLGVGLWAMILLMSEGTPGWYEPVIVLTGVVGIGLAVAAFLTADRRIYPWALMGGSTAVLIAAFVLTSMAG